jgi:hypothetical protein
MEVSCLYTDDDDDANAREIGGTSNGIHPPKSKKPIPSVLYVGN